MNDQFSIWILGGDLRQAWLALQMAQSGFSVHTYGMEKSGLKLLPAHPEDDLSGISSASAVLLPMPAATPSGLLYAPLSDCRDEMPQILSRLRPEQLICGGRVSEAVFRAAAQLGLCVHDYFVREELAVANSIPTAEGCIQLAMEHLPVTIHGSRVLILGYGRVGLNTARRFSSLGAQVTAAARRPEVLAQIEADGLSALTFPSLSQSLHAFDLIVNTVPAPVLDYDLLSLTRRDAVIIDLASAPGGVDSQAARALSRTVLKAPGLPGKVAPATAAAAIRRTICNLLQEQKGIFYGTD